MESNEREKSDGRLPFTLRHGYGVGALALATANTAILFFLLKYLIDEVGLAPAVAGVVLFIGKAWDAVIDPLVGRLSDRTRSGMGQRRPWIAAGLVPFVLFFGLIWWGIPLPSAFLAPLYVLLLMGYNTAYSMIVVPYGAMTPQLTSDYDERTRLNGARMGWSMVGGIVAGVGFPMIFASETGSWRTAGLVMAGLAVLPLLVLLWTTRGRGHIAAPIEAEPTRSFASTWTVLRNRAFRRTAGLFLVAWSTIAVVSAVIPFYVEHHMHQKGMLDIVFACIQFAALFAIPLVVWLAKHMQKHKAYSITVGSWAAVLLSLALVPPDTVAPVLLLAVLSGAGVAAAHVLPWSMLPDVIEADRVEQGFDRTGDFYGVMTFLEQGVSATALWVLGMVLQAAGYAQTAAVQPDSAHTAILFMVGPVPGIILLVAAYMAWTRPPTTRTEHEEHLRILADNSRAPSPGGVQTAK